MLDIFEISDLLKSNFERTRSISKNKRDKCVICKIPMRKRFWEESTLPYSISKDGIQICSWCLNDYNVINDLIEEGCRSDIEHDTAILKSETNNETVSNLQKTEVHTIDNDKKEDEHLDFLEMVSKMKETIIGQDRQIEKLCATIIKNSLTTDAKRKNHIIIVGNSGTGKTLMLDELSKVTNKICSYENATTYTEEGYVGNSVNEMLLNLLNKANGNLKKAEEGIIVIDEGDKKGGKQANGRDVSGHQVLFALLKMLDGTDVVISKNTRYDASQIVFNTSKLTFVFIGVFPGIDELRKKRLTNNAIGFGLAQDSSIYSNSDIVSSDFISLGFPKEYVARFNVIIEMNNLNKEAIISILNSKYSYLQSEIQKLNTYGVEIKISKNVINEIADNVINLNIGARGIELISNYILENVWVKVLRKEGYTKCVLQEGITVNNLKFKIS